MASKSRNRGGARTPRTAGGRAPASGKTASGTAQLTAPATAQSSGKAPSATAPPGTDAADDKAGYYPGAQFGLPKRGPGSVSSMPRRLLALLLDWLLSMLIAYWLTHSQFWTILVFAVEVYVLTALTGFTVGKRLCGIRAVRVDGGPIGLGWALVRTAILLTAIPPLLTDRDLRGLHDRAANTIVVRL